MEFATVNNRYALRRMWRFLQWYSTLSKNGELYYPNTFLMGKSKGQISLDNPDRELEGILSHTRGCYDKVNAGLCVLCGSKDALEKDHIIPKSKGGPDSIEYIITLCKKCNGSGGKWAKDLVQWLIIKEYNIANLVARNRIYGYKGSDYCLISIYIRRQYEFLNINNKLDVTIPEYYITVLKQVEEKIPPQCREMFFKVYPMDKMSGGSQ